MAQPSPQKETRMSIGEVLTEGDPRTLGNADTVVNLVLDRPERLDELIGCILHGDDDVVRIRAADALEKVCRPQPSLLQPHAPLLLGAMAPIDQPSVQWHVAQMLGHLDLNAGQRTSAARSLRRYLDQSSDWIVLNWSLETLAALARTDTDLVEPLQRYPHRFEHSTYTSLPHRAGKLLTEFAERPPDTDE